MSRGAVTADLLDEADLTGVHLENLDLTAETLTRSLEAPQSFHS
jgi:hypothetical protein